MHASSNMNLIICFFCALLSVQQMPMAFAARPLKGTRGGVHVETARTLQEELVPSDESVDSAPALADDGEELPSADSEDSGGDSEDSKGRVAGPSERDCKMSKEDDGVEFECKVKEEDEASDFELKDKIDFNITAGESGLRAKIRYEHEIETSNMETETETEYEVIFDRIIEYRKAASSADSTEKAYEWDSDDIIQTVSLSDWETFSDVTDDAAGIVSHFSVSSLDGHVNFNFTVSRADQGERVTANKMKIDFRLVDFPWLHNDTYVALLSTVESKREVDVDYEDDIDVMSPTPASRIAKDVIISFAEAQDAVGVIPFGEYTWAQTAEVVLELISNETTAIQRSGIEQVGGIPTIISVVATSPTYLENTAISQQWIAFSFVGDAAISASNIYWDPEAGIGYSESASAAGVDAAGVESSNANPISSFFFALSGALTCWMYLSAL